MQSALFDSPGKVRRILDDSLFQPRPAIYWLDFSFSISLAWLTFFFGLPQYSAGVWAGMAAIAVSVLAFYRALFFIHEISHLKKETLRAFRLVWNALCGCAFFLPDFTYLIHASHHSIRTFSTNDDPEYMPLAYQRPLELLAPFLIFPFAPLLLMVHFLVATPLSWVIGGRFREWLLGHASSLKMNPHFEWKDISAQEHRLAVLQEVGCLAWWSVFLGAGLTLIGRGL